MILAHMYEKTCSCSRCRVAREYARLRAAQAASAVADPSQPLATQLGIPSEHADGLHDDTVTHPTYALT